MAPIRSVNRALRGPRFSATRSRSRRSVFRDAPHVAAGGRNPKRDLGLPSGRENQKYDETRNRRACRRRARATSAVKAELLCRAPSYESPRLWFAHWAAYRGPRKHFSSQARGRSASQPYLLVAPAMRGRIPPSDLFEMLAQSQALALIVRLGP
jgi:hypothetical protein